MNCHEVFVGGEPELVLEAEIGTVAVAVSFAVSGFFLAHPVSLRRRADPLICPEFSALGGAQCIAPARYPQEGAQDSGRGDGRAGSLLRSRARTCPSSADFFGKAH